MGVFCEDLGENWPRYNGTALYLLGFTTDYLANIDKYIGLLGVFCISRYYRYKFLKKKICTIMKWHPCLRNKVLCTSIDTSTLSLIIFHQKSNKVIGGVDNPMIIYLTWAWLNYVFFSAHRLCFSPFNCRCSPVPYIYGIQPWSPLWQQTSCRAPSQYKDRLS